MSDMVPFFYGEQIVRTVIIDGQPWFVVSDMAKVLGYRDASNASRLLRPHQQGYSDVSTPSGSQRMLVCSEGGVNRLIMRSNAKRAEEIQDWFTDQVMPEIRRTGSYQPQPHPVIDLEDTDVALDKIIELASIAKGERAGRLKAEARLEVEQRHRHAIEGGDGIDPTTFGKKYFGDVPARQFDKHLYEHDYLIDQRKTRRSSNGEMKDGYDHRKPTANGRRYFYPHDGGTHGGRRRFNPRVRPQMEIALRDALIAEGLPANTHSTGLVLISNKEMQELGA